MKFDPIEIKDKSGRTVILRSAEVSDGDAMLDYLKTTATETPFLSREPEEIALTSEQQASFIQSRINSPNELMLIALIDGKHIGNCALARLGAVKRYRHRCSVSIALYKEYCGCGIGEAMMKTVLSVAKELGYEQAELEVIADNTPAINLYKKLGFTEYGRFPDNMKYKDGSYSDAIWMMKKLK
ncbi:MAG: GNAT family N-acetyltransferase [Clostridia bacterium]|nr:GNAT family N-acetyltransferase [Clostridia bacterium]